MKRLIHRAQCVVFIDADNTLWDTNRVYADAQLSLLTDVERASGRHAKVDNRLGWLREIDQALAERHHAGLRYPPRLLAKAVALALIGEGISSAARLAWSGGLRGVQLDEATADRIEIAFFDRLKVQPMLRDGVAQGLRALHEAGCEILVLTEGSREKVLSLIARYGLADLITRVIEAKKERRLFERVIALTRQPTMAFMIGDQFDRDIAPAIPREQPMPSSSSYASISTASTRPCRRARPRSLSAYTCAAETSKATI